MYVTVSLKIELNAKASLTEMERQIQAGAGNALMPPQSWLYVSSRSMLSGKWLLLST